MAKFCTCIMELNDEIKFVYSEYTFLFLILLVNYIGVTKMRHEFWFTFYCTVQQAWAEE